MAGSDKSPLELLSAAAGREFPNLLKAREATAAGFADRSPKLEAFEHDDDVSVVLMGSWGRAEVTSGSDDDFMVLVNGPERSEVKPSIEQVKSVLTEAPGSQGLFGNPVFCDLLVDNIGLDRDDNRNLTRRMLFLLESAPATRDEVYAAARDRVLRRYLDESVKDYRPPRFLLNDTIRYWRTICVDFAGKEKKGSEKWGLQNAKLRTSRKVLFAGGLLPILDCVEFTAGDMQEFLESQFDVPPTDRIASSFLKHDRADAGGRALGAYDEFLGLLDDQAVRDELRDVTRATADESPAFARAGMIARELESGLLALLFESESLPKLVRDYGVF